MNIVTGILIFAVSFPLVYLAIAGTALAFGRFPEPAGGPESMGLDEVRALVELPGPQEIRARDGLPMSIRLYPGNDRVTFILCHGSGSDNRHLGGLATWLATERLATVVTPDLRGHGADPPRRGDVDYIGQAEDDIADLVGWCRTRFPGAKMVLGGLSIGGGLAIRYAGGRNPAVDGYVLLSPYIHHRSPAHRPGSGNWATPNLGRFTGLTMLNNFGIRILNRLAAVRFHLPMDLRDGRETLDYSYRLFTSLVPRDNYRRDIAAMDRPTLLVAGSQDSIFKADAYPKLFAGNANVRCEVVPGLTHLGVLFDARARQIMAGWFATLAGREAEPVAGVTGTAP